MWKLARGYELTIAHDSLACLFSASLSTLRALLRYNQAVREGKNIKRETERESAFVLERERKIMNYRENMKS